MIASERRVKIMRILYRRGHQTVSALADEFGVSERTIERDISILSMDNPIYTKMGRYGGGVYIIDSDYNKYQSRKAAESEVLEKVIGFAKKKSICNLDEDEILILNRMANSIN